MLTRRFSCQRGALTIRGTEFRPEGDGLPIAVVCHGFMANQGTVRHYARYLAELGYAAYCFDFCGGCVLGGRSDGRTTDMSVLTEVEDLLAVIRYAWSMPYTAEDGLLLMGCSQGGFVSALAAARLREAVGGLILFYPALCIPDDARAGRMMFARFDPAAIPETFSCGPMRLGRCYPADVMEMDPFREIAPYPGSVLIVHGTADAIVKHTYAERAAAAYAAGRAEPSGVTLKLISGGKHGFGKNHDALAMDYIREYLGK